MRISIKTITSKMSTRTITTLAVSLFAVIILPVVALAYGPERPTYTQEVPADHVTFNSITNNPKYGDERNFMRVRDVEAGTPTGKSVELKPGKEYEVNIFYHNNASSGLNASGVGIAKGAYAKAVMPAVARAGSAATEANAFVGATNASPAAVYDYIDIFNKTGGDMAIRYVTGSATIHSNGAVNNQKLPDALFSAAGTPIGFDSLNGVLPGCDNYSGYITYRFVADQPNFTFKKDVRVSGTKPWVDSTAAQAGNKIDYLLSYKNTGTTEQKNVVLKDVMPKGVTYINGSSVLTNGNHPSGTKLDDGINAGGINIGSYLPGGAGYLTFSATINGGSCETITNTAGAETNNGTAKDTATVTISGENCKAVPAELPTTGPAEFIASIVALAALTIGFIYYYKSRRDLQDALHHVTHDVPTEKHEDTK